MTPIGPSFNSSLLQGQQIAAQSRQNNNDHFRSKATDNLDNQVSQVVAKSASGTNPNIKYRYASGENGELIPIEATVTTSVEKKTPIPDKPILNNGSNSLVSISPSEQLDAFGLSDEEKQLVNELRSRDLEVRVHEAQHFLAAGGLASGGSEFQLQTGPDGNVYAIGGHVNISSGHTNDPEKAARDASTFALAANAPADGSAQDRAVANSSLSRAADLYSQIKELTLGKIDDTKANSIFDNNVPNTPNTDVDNDKSKDSFTPITV